MDVNNRDLRDGLRNNPVAHALYAAMKKKLAQPRWSEMNFYTTQAK